MAGYVRQSLADIVPGLVVQAGPLNKEFNLLASTFSGSSGHTHDGTTGNGPRLSLTHSVSGILPVANGGTGSSDLAEIQDNLGLQIGTDVQAYSEALKNLSLKTGTGIVVRSTGTAWELRELKGAAKEVKVSNSQGVANDPVIGFADELDFGTRKIAGGDFTSIKAVGTFDGDGSKLRNIQSTNVSGLNTELGKKFDKVGGTISGPTSFADNVSVQNGKQITLQTAPTNANHVVNKATLDSASTEDRKRDNHTGTQEMSTIRLLSEEFSKYLKLAGGVMTGLLNMGAQRITNLAAGTEPSDAVRLDQLQSFAPTGSMLPFAGTNPPSTYLICDGRAVSRTTYSALFAVIGTRYGSGDGLSTFNIPDTRGRVLAGTDTAGLRLSGKPGGVSGSLGSVGGSEVTTLISDNLPKITYPSVPSRVTVPINGWGTTGGAPSSNVSIEYGRIVTGSGENERGGETLESLRAGGSSQSLPLDGWSTPGTVGRSSSFNNVQPTLVMNYIIKT